MTPPTQATSTNPPTHNAISAAINDAQHLQTLVRESPGPIAVTPPPSRLGLPSDEGTTVGRQGRLGERGGDLKMEEDNSTEARRVSDVHMETLDLGGDDDDI